MTGPIGTSSKRKQRIENKKKKMAALLDIVKLNENDRQKNKSTKLVLPENIEEKCTQVNVGMSGDSHPSPKKKLKTEEIIKDGELGPSGKPRLEGVQLAELKKMLREKTNKIKQAPKFRLREMGENATLKMDLESRCPLFLSDIQHLLMYSQVGVHSPYSPARWCQLEKYNRLSNVTVLIIENVSLYHYEGFESYFPFLSTNFDYKIEIISPFSYNSDFVKELSMVPLSATQMRKLINEYGSLEEAAKKSNEIFDTINNFFPVEYDLANDAELHGLNSKLPPSDNYPRTKLLLSGWQMVEENFPLPIKGLIERKYSDYKLTKDKYKPVAAQSPLIALDCEMCKTAIGDLELTRVSLVNENHDVLYDTLVKPENKIVDYLTRYSGINSKMLKNVTKKLKDVQDEVRQLLPNDAILVGHSLSNDLHALKMMHPYVIDTSVIYNLSGDRTRKTKLQTLAREFLDEKIQAGTHGHCSSEDSLACMKLAQLKLGKHPYYGDAVMSSVYTEQRAYPDIGTANYATSMFNQCIKVGNTVNIIAVDNVPDKYRFYFDKKSTEEVINQNINCVKLNSNRDVIKHLSTSLNKHALNIGHIRISNDHLKEAEMETTFKTIDKWISEVHSSSMQPALIAVLLSGQKDGGNGACFIHLKSDHIS